MRISSRNAVPAQHQRQRTVYVGVSRFVRQVGQAVGDRAPEIVARIARQQARGLADQVHLVIGQRHRHTAMIRNAPAVMVPITQAAQTNSHHNARKVG